MPMIQRDAARIFDPDIGNDSLLWRYYDLAKFTAMLQTSSLYFSRVDLLGDPLEGSLTKAYEISRQSLLDNAPDGFTPDMLEKVRNSAIDFRKNMRKCLYVNCWYLGDHESMAMWRGYGGEYGIAVQTTFQQLNDTIPLKLRETPFMGNICIGRVRYIDHASVDDPTLDTNNFLAPFACKSNIYEHEKELRALFCDMSHLLDVDQAPVGYNIETDLKHLIQVIRVSPLAQPWFKDVIQNLCNMYKLNVKIEHSPATNPPVF